MLSGPMLYNILLIVSNVILGIIWMISLQQYCVSDFYEKSRMNRLLSAVLFITLSLALNMLVYLDKLYPNTQVHAGVSLYVVICVFEALYVIIAFHIFRVFHVWSIDQFYSPFNMKIPKWYHCFFNVLQLSVIVMVCICYSFVFIYDESDWIIIFYVFIALIILIQATFALFNLRKVSKYFKDTNSQQNASIKSAKRYIGTIYVLTSTICVYCVFQAFMCIEMLVSDPYISFYDEIGIAFTHSVIFIVLALVLIVWMFQSTPCCGCCGHISDTSVCIVIGCEWFCQFWFYLCCCYGCVCCDEDTIRYELETTLKTTRTIQTSTNANTATHTTGIYVTNEQTNGSSQNLINRNYENPCQSY
eukprot:78772_1